jgi:RNA polymerase sigma-70 factor (ECF subfamily)
MSLYLKKDQDLFFELYNEHHQLVRNVLYNMVGAGPLDDLVQEAFIKIWKGLPSFGFRSSVKTWIYRITMNTALDYRKKRRLETTELFDDDWVHDESRENPVKEKVQDALKSLDDDVRAVLVMYYFEELQISEIAKIMEIPEGTVKSRMHTAKQKFKDQMISKGAML